MKDEQAVISVEKLTLCRDCKNGEKDEFFPQMVFCRLTRRWMNGTGFCSDGEERRNV